MTKLTRFSPNSDMLSSLHRDINRLFYPFVFGDDIDQTMPTASNWTADWAPSIDIKDEAKQYVIHADVPGVDPKAIKVNLDNNVLTVKGEKETQSKEEKKDYMHVERAKGTFMRSFRLPETVDADNIQAKSKHGVLEIVIPKTKKSGAIDIKVEE